MSEPENTDAPARRGLVAGRFYPWLSRCLAHRRAQSVILVLSLVLMLPSLDTGLAADDYVHQLMLDGSHAIEGFVRAPLDIFRFCGPRLSRLLVRDGVLTFWDDPNTRLSFFRPVSALTHLIDNRLWHDSPWLMHLQSLLWGAVVLLGVRALYRELVADRFIATLGFALYALDDARGWFVSWVAARNAVVATAFSVWALVLHHRGRTGKSRHALWLAPLLLGLGLLAGEGAIAIYGYLIAYTLFLESGRLWPRLVRLWPYALLLVVWRVVYRLLDYGVSGSSLYADPLSDPQAFVMRFLERAPVLLGAQLGGFWSDTWTSLFVFPRARVLIFLVALASIAIVSVLLSPHVKRSPLVRFAVVGGLLGTLPASSAFPADRLLTWIAIGASLALAELLAPSLRATPEPPRSLWLARLTGPVVFLLIIANLVMGPLFIPSRARGNAALREILVRADAGVPRDPSITDKTLILLNPPAVPLASYIPITRAALGVPRARTQRLLATGTSELTITRDDPFTLRLRPAGGFLQNPASQLFWNDQRPFTKGEQIALGDELVQITEVTADRRPLEVTVHFQHPLEDASYVWRQWLGTGYVEFIPPAPGKTVVLPSADYLEVMLGRKLSVEARFRPQL